MIVAELFAKLGLIPDEGSFTKGDKLIEGLHHALEAYIGYEAVKGITEMVMHTVELGSKINDTSIKTGIATEQLSYLGYVAKLNGSSMDAMAHAATKLNRHLDEAATKGGAPAAALQRLGLSAQGLSKLPVDEKMQKIAEKIAAIEDPGKRTAVAMELFGRSGAELIPTLVDLGKNGKELRDEFDEMGGGMKKETAEALDKFGDDVDRAKTRLEKLKNSIVVSLLPTLQEMLTGFIEWVKVNRELISDALRTVIEGLVMAFRALGFVVTEIIVPVLQFLRDHMEIVKDVLIGLGVVLAAFAIQAALAWVVAFAPILIIIGAIALLVAAVRKAYDWIKNGTGPVHDAFMLIVNTVKHAVETVISVGRRIGKFFAEDIPNAIIAAWDAMWAFIYRKLDEFITRIQSNSILRGIVNFASGGSGMAVLDRFHPINESGQSEYALAHAGGVATTTNNITTGDAHITVNPSTGMDEKAIGQAAADAAKKHVDDQVKQAVESIKGGRR